MLLLLLFHFGLDRSPFAEETHCSHQQRSPLPASTRSPKSTAIGIAVLCTHAGLPIPPLHSSIFSISSTIPTSQSDKSPLSATIHAPEPFAICTLGLCHVFLAGFCTLRPYLSSCTLFPHTLHGYQYFKTHRDWFSVIATSLLPHNIDIQPPDPPLATDPTITTERTACPPLLPNLSRTWSFTTTLSFPPRLSLAPDAQFSLRGTLHRGDVADAQGLQTDLLSPSKGHFSAKHGRKAGRGSLPAHQLAFERESDLSPEDWIITSVKAVSVSLSCMTRRGPHELIELPSEPDSVTCPLLHLTLSFFIWLAMVNQSLSTTFFHSFFLMAVVLSRPRLRLRLGPW